jgi:hypothetical protein
MAWLIIHFSVVNFVASNVFQAVLANQKGTVTSCQPPKTGFWKRQIMTVVSTYIHI